MSWPARASAGSCCSINRTQPAEDGFPIISRDTQLANFYHALGMNGHGITCHAAIAQAVAELMLRGGTSLDISALVGHPERMDFAALDAGRFARGELLDFELRRTED